MDRFFYQLTVLGATAGVILIGLSTLFPSQRQGNLLNVSPQMANNPTLLEIQD